MGFEEGEIILDSPTGTYYSGQEVNGRVVFELSKRKIVRGIFLKVEGWCEVHWTSQKSRRVNDRTEYYTVSHDSHEDYIDVKDYLVGGKKSELELKPGKHEYPFNFEIPDNCPSSFEGSYGHVTYELKAVADRPFKVDQEITQSLTVIAPLDLNDEDCKDPYEFELDQRYCCWFMSAGSAHTVVKLPVTGFCPGQTIPLEVSCTNTSNVEIAQIKFSIKEDTTYHATENPGKKHETDTIFEVCKGPISANSERNWTVELELPDQSEMPVYNLSDCSFIDKDYRLKISVEASGCHRGNDDWCSIVFGTVPIVGFQDDLSEDENEVAETTTFPVANNPYPQPIINQPIAVNNFQHSSSPYPGPNPPYPNNSPYPSPNPPYPGGEPLPNISPFTGANPPYPNTSPYPSPDPPYPNSSPVQGIAPYPYPSVNPPYPNSTPMQENSPYPNSILVHGNLLYPNSTPVQGNPLYPNSTPVQGNPLYPSSTPVQGNPPYLNSTPMQGNSPYPNSAPVQGNPPYPNSTPVQGNPPYPNSAPVHGNPPYPNSTPVQGNPPYPNSTPVQGNPPYPNSAPVHGNPPYPNSTPVQGNLPYSNGTMNSSSYPGSNPTCPGAGGGLKTGAMGLTNVKDPASIPLLPEGAAVPCPPNVTSPYATASAPEAGTPRSEQKNMGDLNLNNSAYNPEFINKN